MDTASVSSASVACPVQPVGTQEVPTRPSWSTKKNDNETTQLALYIQTLTPKEYKAYLIAQSHLGMSFDLCKSRGFIEWKKTQDFET